MDESLSLYPGGGDRIREREKDSSLLRTKFSESWRLEQAMVSPFSHRDVVSDISLWKGGVADSWPGGGELGGISIGTAGLVRVDRDA